MERERHFFIVARDQADLCQYLQREFSTEEAVQVFLDRRGGERRSGRDRRVAPRPPDVRDRRGNERRTRAFVDTQLRSLGYAMLRIGQSRLNVYLAAPLFSDAERRLNLDLCRSLEAAGHRVYLPQRDTPAATGPGRTRRLFEANLAGLARAEAVVAVLEGAQVDDGTAWEIGWAHARGMPIFGLRTDRRLVQQPDEPVNLMIFESLRRLSGSVEDLLATLGV